MITFRGGPAEGKPALNLGRIPAVFDFVNEQPTDAEMRDNKLWSIWCESKRSLYET